MESLGYRVWQKSRDFKKKFILNLSKPKSGLEHYEMDNPRAQIFWYKVNKILKTKTQSQKKTNKISVMQNRK